GGAVPMATEMETTQSGDDEAEDTTTTGAVPMATDMETTQSGDDEAEDTTTAGAVPMATEMETTQSGDDEAEDSATGDGATSSSAAGGLDIATGPQAADAEPQDAFMYFPSSGAGGSGECLDSSEECWWYGDELICWCI
ncbi:MAG: hypothetical protein AAFX99_19715, partial [Myxococcota bacterium]